MDRVLVASSAPAAAAPFGYVIVVDLVEGCTLHRIDLATGALDPALAAPDDGACATDLAFSPDGATLYGTFDDTDTVALVRFDLATGVATGVGQIGDFDAQTAVSPLGGGGLAFDAAGVLYTTLVPEDPDAPDADCQNQGGALYGVGISIGGPASVFSIDRATGAATVTAPITPPGTFFPLALAIPKACDLGITFTG